MNAIDSASPRARTYRDRSPHAAQTGHLTPAPTALRHAASHTDHDTFELASLTSNEPCCNHAAELAALKRDIADVRAHLPVKNGQPSKFYQGLADGLWYAGHVISTGSLLSRESYPAAIAMVLLGQSLTIASRLIGRIQERMRGVSDDTA